MEYAKDRGDIILLQDAVNNISSIENSPTSSKKKKRSGIQSSLQRPPENGNGALSAKKKSQLLSSSKKSQRARRQNQMGHQTAEQPIQVQSEVPDLLETQQFTQSFLQKLIVAKKEP